MKPERTTVSQTLWRKKVDSSLFEYQVTTIPTWLCKQWNISKVFSKCISFADEKSHVEIFFEGKSYQGYVTVAKNGRKSPAFRLWFDEDLLFKIKEAYPMSYMRHLEAKLRDARDNKSNKSKKKNQQLAVEDDIPFWEFLDMEYNALKRQFTFAAHYKQKPTFPLLFEQLQGQPMLRSIEESLIKGEKQRIQKSKWYKRDELEMQLGAQNVIYFLYDSKNNLFYVGEAKDLVKRLRSNYGVIPDWDWFRYDVLPAELAPYRVTIERMIIFSFSMIFKNRKHSDGKAFSLKHMLVNDKIDRS